MKLISIALIQLELKNRIMKLLRLILILLIFGICSCQNKTEKNKTDKMENGELKILLEKQIKAGYAAEKSETDYPNYDFTELDLNISCQILSEYLIKNGYKVPTNEKFNEVLSVIFHRNLDYNSAKKNVYLNFTHPCYREIKFLKNNSEELQDYSFYINKEGNFITELFSIPEILDYEKVFPDIVKFENSLPSVTNDIKIYKWNSFENLSKVRQQNLNAFIYRNKFLFNKDKASLVWLKFNDKNFLESLVKTFGYVQDKDLLKWVIEKNILKTSQDNVDEFAKILWTRNCDNKIEVHKEVFDFMLTQDEREREKYLTSFLIFMDDYKNKETDLNFSEVAKIKAFVSYYGTKITDSNFYSFFPQLNDQKYEEEFKKNNYYNISDFKQLYDDAKSGGTGLPE